MSQQPGDRGNGATEGPFANGLAAQRKGLWKTVFRGVVTVAVVAAVIWTGWKGYLDLRKQEGLSWEQFHWQWLPIASLLYFLGMLPSWGYWHWLLSRSGLTVNLRDSFRAFFMSQLGKYIPGKVMVILIRTAVISHQQVDRDRVTTLRGQHTWITVTATAFMETLTFIAMGGLVGVVAGAGFFSERPWVIGVALLVAAAMFAQRKIPPEPPSVRRQFRSTLLQRFRDERAAQEAEASGARGRWAVGPRVGGAWACGRGAHRRRSRRRSTRSERASCAEEE